jgi:hypothetical protein
MRKHNAKPKPDGLRCSADSCREIPFTQANAQEVRLEEFCPVIDRGKRGPLRPPRGIRTLAPVSAGSRGVIAQTPRLAI